MRRQTGVDRMSVEMDTHHLLLTSFDGTLIMPERRVQASSDCWLSIEMQQTILIWRNTIHLAALEIAMFRSIVEDGAFARFR
ncbi:MAG TPA: hypothetical protein VGD58_21435 [Herpetosiphonaceae bacterium]